MIAKKVIVVNEIDGYFERLVLLLRGWREAKRKPALSTEMKSPS
jgi:hypothetical protein